MTDIEAFIRARLAERRRMTIPKTVMVSGGTGPRDTHAMLTCLGADRTGDCDWKIDILGIERATWEGLGDEHALTHANAEQRWTMRDIAAKLAMLDWLNFFTEEKDDEWFVTKHVLEFMALPDAGHPDYDESWRP